MRESGMRLFDRIITIKKRMSEAKKHTMISLSSTVRNSFFEGDNYIGKRSVFLHGRIGAFSYISDDCFFVRTLIGKYTAIAPSCRIVFGDHPTREFVSIHPAFYKSKRPAGRCFVEEDRFDEVRYVDKDERIMLSIGNDVWMSTGVTLMAGIEVGDGAVIAAGAVVTKDVLPYSVVAGVPARVVRYRFDSAEIEALKRIKWWDWPESVIRQRVDCFRDIRLFNEFIEHSYNLQDHKS